MDMIRRLHEAAVEGSVTALLELLREDPLILDRQIIGFYSETPLHIAAVLGHVEFAKEILTLKPELAGERDWPQKSTPLHFTAAKGYMEIAKALLLVNPEMCLACDRNQRNPLHIAAMKGKIGVLKELVRSRPQAARVVADRGETILHLCVKHNQLEALKVLVETMQDDHHEFLSSKDDDGNTILHLAVDDKQIETINFLISKTEVEVNAQNGNGYTALDILAQSRRDVNDMVIGDSLQLAGALRAKDIHSLMHEFRPIRTSKDQKEMALQRQLAGKNWEIYVQNQDEWLEKKRSTLMVVASLMATMAFQVGVNPPGGVWQENILEGDTPHIAGYSIMAYQDSSSYNTILAFNTTSFITSLSMILLLISGLPTKRRFFMWILMVIMWIAITSTALTYSISIASLIPAKFDPDYTTFNSVIRIWISLMAFLLLGHTVRLIVKFRRSCRGRGPSSSMIMNLIVKFIIRLRRRRKGQPSSSMILNHGSV